MYCKKCGTRCDETKKQTGFNTETGSPIYDVTVKCPVDECGHKGRQHHFKLIKRSIWWRISYLFHSEDEEIKCDKCGLQRKWYIRH
jgi:hypothetical protein